MKRWRKKEFIQNLKDFGRRHFIAHYLIIGHHTQKPIGCTYGRQGQLNVLKEEPQATFKSVSQKKCPICNKYITRKDEKINGKQETKT